MVTKAYAHEGFYYMIEGVCVCHVCAVQFAVFLHAIKFCAQKYLHTCGHVAYICNLYMYLYIRRFSKTSFK